MGNMICCIPADNKGNKLFIKDFKVENNRTFVKYRSTYNDIPFMDVEIFPVEDKFAICGNDGTILYRFSMNWIQQLIEE